MTTTADALVLAAMGLSAKNRPEQIATHETELVRVLNSIFNRIYTMAARVNPDYFGAVQEIAYSSGGWARPAQANLVWRIEEVSTNREVIVVRADQRDADPARPAVYLTERMYRAAGNPLDPTSGSLRFRYAKWPTPLVDLNSTVDALWVEQFNDLPILMLGLYLARKDNRASEIEGLVTERDEVAKGLIAFLQHETTNLVVNYDYLRTFNVQQVVAILDGGGK